jgi:hypothetical protein
VARSTVRETLKRAEGAGLSWPLPDDMNDEALEAALYASRRSKRGHRRIAEPDWASVHRELKRKHVTLLILEASPDKQVSLTDPDARSMATSGKGTGIVGYNVQMAVDAEHRLIVAHEVTNIGSDRSQLTSMGHKAQEAAGCDELTVLADRGYLQHEAHDQHLRRQTAHAGNRCLIKVSRNSTVKTTCDLTVPGEACSGQVFTRPRSSAVLRGRGEECLRRAADSAPKAAASGRTGVRPIATIPSRAWSTLHGSERSLWICVDRGRGRADSEPSLRGAMSLILCSRKKLSPRLV